MKRREFITILGGAATFAPFAARAQQGERVRRIGVLMGVGDTAEGRARLEAFRETLNQLGRQNAQLEVRWASGDPVKAHAYAKELVALRPDIILTNATAATRAVQRETTDIPVVFVVVSDPVGDGIVTSLARPGGNLTGFTSFEFSLASKWLELLKETVPRLRRVAMLFNPTTAPGKGWAYVDNAKAVAASFPLEVVPIPVTGGSEIDAGLDKFVQSPDGGLLVVPDSFTSAHAPLIVANATRNRLPAVYPLRLFVLEGGLLSYGIDQLGQFRQGAAYVDRVLRGQQPSELPVQAPNKFELVINLKAATAIGLTVPPLLLARADEVIE